MLFLVRSARFIFGFLRKDFTKGFARAVRRPIQGLLEQFAAPRPKVSLQTRLLEAEFL
jgi:hypothetical protein